jgi:hypothetical protein
VPEPKVPEEAAMFGHSRRERAAAGVPARGGGGSLSGRAALRGRGRCERFSSLVLRTAYGPAFAAPTADDETFLETLGTMVRRYLYGT